MSDQSELLPVSPEARRAAYEHGLRTARLSALYEEAIMAGDWDHTDDLQSFARFERDTIARHRLSVGEVDEPHLVKRVAKAMNAWTTGEPDGRGRYWSMYAGQRGKAFASADEAYEHVRELNAKSAIAALSPTDRPDGEEQ